MAERKVVRTVALKVTKLAVSMVVSMDNCLEGKQGESTGEGWVDVMAARLVLSKVA